MVTGTSSRCSSERKVKGFVSNSGVKRLSFWELVSIGVGGMIGGGIFSVLGLAAQHAGPLTPVSFLLAGIVAGLTAYSFAAFSRRYTTRGGAVEYIAHGFKRGEMVGTVNLLFLFSYVVMLALYSYTFGSYLSADLGMYSELTKRLFAVLVLVFFAALNLRGAKVVGRSELLIVATKLFILLFFVVVGLLLAPGLPKGSVPPLIDVLLGAFLIFLAYEGFELITNASEEAEDPVVNIPKALFTSVAIVILVYVLVSYVAVSSLNPAELFKYRDYALAEAAKPFLGTAGFLLISLAALLSTASAINATLFGAARIAYVLAKEGVLPEAHRGPWHGITEGLVLVTAATVFLVLFLDLQGIAFLGSAGFLIIYTLVNLSALRMRKELQASGTVLLLSSLSTLLALLVLVYGVARTNPAEVTLLFGVIFLAFFVETVYRKVKMRRLHMKLWREI